ncbi:MAG: hypothetical protein VX120_05005, partial [Pseudomonadota bacterium]|nr:hypothetical protein [Pseudomonadota bacterium]
MSEDILLAVGDTLRERLEDHARDGAQIRNVFSIFVELMQNIMPPTMRVSRRTGVISRSSSTRVRNR